MPGLQAGQDTDSLVFSGCLDEAQVPGAPGPQADSSVYPN